MALPDREITVTGKVAEVGDGVAKVEVRAEQDGKAIVRGGEADLRSSCLAALDSTSCCRRARS